MKPPVFRDRASATFGGETIFYGSEQTALSALREIWEPELREVYAPVPPSQRPAPRREGSRFPPPEAERSCTFTLREEQEAVDKWRFGLAKNFRKAVESIDRKLQGRILEAIADITAGPLVARGDTVKRLTRYGRLLAIPDR